MLTCFVWLPVQKTSQIQQVYPLMQAHEHTGKDIKTESPLGAEINV